MKKVILFFALMITSISIFAQADSTAIAGATTTGLTLLWPYVSNFIIAHAAALTIILGVWAAISELLSYLKWKPNGVIQAVFLIVKTIFNFIISKKV
jgi:hypothetical protein